MQSFSQLSGSWGALLLRGAAMPLVRPLLAGMWARVPRLQIRSITGRLAKDCREMPQEDMSPEEMRRPSRWAPFQSDIRRANIADSEPVVRWMVG